MGLRLRRLGRLCALLLLLLLLLLSLSRLERRPLFQLDPNREGKQNDGKPSPKNAEPFEHLDALSNVKDDLDVDLPNAVEWHSIAVLVERWRKFDGQVGDSDVDDDPEDEGESDEAGADERDGTLSDETEHAHADESGAPPSHEPCAIAKSSTEGDFERDVEERDHE